MKKANTYLSTSKRGVFVFENNNGLNDKKLLNEGVKGHLTTGKIKIKENIDVFICPVCGEAMGLDDNKSLICSNRHCFDISKRGYINLLLNSPKSQYDKELFQARNAICEMGFFNPLTQSIVLLAGKNISKIKSQSIRILDAGCGEGFHLSEIIGGLINTTGLNIQGVGIDISKEGVQIASKNHKDIIWCVANLAKIPFADRRFDIVLNILSPSNYSEFGRIICNDGMLIKVVPGSDYLKELRQTFYENTDKKTYSSERVVEHFSKNFDIVDTKKLKYSVKINKDELKHLIRMTPLSWGVTNETIDRAFKKGIDCVTADFTIMIGKRNQ